MSRFCIGSCPGQLPQASMPSYASCPIYSHCHMTQIHQFNTHSAQRQSSVNGIPAKVPRTDAWSQKQTETCGSAAVPVPLCKLLTSSSCSRNATICGQKIFQALNPHKLQNTECVLDQQPIAVQSNSHKDFITSALKTACDA